MYNNQRTLIIKDLSRLKDYGFTKEGDSYYFYTGNKGKYGKPVYTIYISGPHRWSRKEHIVIVYSHGSITLEVICRMYADGVITFKNGTSLDTRIERKEKQILKLENEIKELKEQL